MFFGLVSPIFFILPLVFFFAVARVISRYIGGNGRRGYREVPEEFGRPEIFNRPIRPLAGARNSDQSKVFRLALKLKGRVTVSDVVIETGLGLQEAETLMESMVDNVHVRMEVDDQGRVLYEFPEIIRRLEGGS